MLPWFLTLGGGSPGSKALLALQGEPNDPNRCIADTQLTHQLAQRHLLWAVPDWWLLSVAGRGPVAVRRELRVFLQESSLASAHRAGSSLWDRARVPQPQCGVCSWEPSPCIPCLSLRAGSGVTSVIPQLPPSKPQSQPRAQRSPGRRRRRRSTTATCSAASSSAGPGGSTSSPRASTR